MTVERKKIRELTEREKKLLTPDVQELYDASEALDEAQRRYQQAEQRILRMVSLMHEPASDDDTVNIDLDDMVLYREVPVEPDDAGQEDE